MTEGDNRDPDDREVPANRDHDIGVIFITLALVLGGVIVFQLVFG